MKNLLRKPALIHEYFHRLELYATSLIPFRKATSWLLKTAEFGGYRYPHVFSPILLAKQLFSHFCHCNHSARFPLHKLFPSGSIHSDRNLTSVFNAIKIIRFYQYCNHAIQFRIAVYGKAGFVYSSPVADSSVIGYLLKRPSRIADIFSPKWQLRCAFDRESNVAYNHVVRNSHKFETMLALKSLLGLPFIVPYTRFDWIKSKCFLSSTSESSKVLALMSIKYRFILNF